jgi:acetyl-CoA acetyltransferase
MTATKHRTAFVGCGYTALTSEPTKTVAELSIEACRAAAEDAGLDPSVLDGINIQMHHGTPPTAQVAQALGMKNLRWSADGGLGVVAAARAATALDAGEADYIVVCKTMSSTNPVNTPLIDANTGRVPGPNQFDVPYGLGYTMQRIGLTSRRWMNRYGITSEQLGWLCIVEREHAMLNPHAFFRTPLTMDEYLSSRWIADPVRLFDCDRPVNGAWAYVITREELAKSLSHPPVYLASWVDSPIEMLEFYLLEEDLGPAPSSWLRPLYADAQIGPEDLDVWMLYDGFSFFPLQWMEALNLVPRGESGPYVEGGTRIRHDGEHPLNTHGGQLSEGRLHGAGHILEAIQQLRGNAGPRQRDGAANAVVTTAFSNTGAAAILTNV